MRTDRQMSISSGTEKSGSAIKARKIMRALMSALSVAVLAVGGNAAHAVDPDYPLARLPILPRPTPVAVEQLATFTEFAPGVGVIMGQAVALTGTLIIDQGPVDGLEVLACLATGKTHESLIRLDAASGQLVKAACIAALGLTDGIPAPEGTGFPARGTPLQVILEWELLDTPGSWKSVDASEMIRDRLTDQPYAAVPFIYTGSRFLVIDEVAPDGRPVKQERFMLDNTKSVINLVDEPDALLASPSPGAGFDKHFEVYSRICPPTKSKVRIILRKTTLPLTLAMDAGGVLLHNGQPLDDAALQHVLNQYYGAAAQPALRAVAIAVHPNTPREHDQAARDRILRLAAAAPCWVIPVYVLSAQQP
jgi:hypothetical protein